MRYAIYAVPGASPENDSQDARRLFETASAWFADPQFEPFVQKAARYGFHATLKAPFRLAENMDEAQLLDEVDSFCKTTQPVVIPQLSLATIGRTEKFYALVPGDPNRIGEVNDFAARVVKTFDKFRAPLRHDEWLKRKPNELTDHQKSLLNEWGYPWVFDQFKLHFTLTDSMSETHSNALKREVAQRFSCFQGSDIELRTLTVCVEPAPREPFRVLSIHSLSSGNALNKQMNR